VTLSLILRFNLRLGGYSIWSAIFHRTPYQRSNSGHEHLIASIEPRKYSKKNFKMELQKKSKTTSEVLKEPTVLSYEELGGLLDPGQWGCVHNVVHTRIGDKTCPIPYLYCILLACEVELADTEGSCSSCTRVRFLGYCRTRIHVTLSPRIYKGEQGPSQNTSTPKVIRTTKQDVGYYAHRGPNLSKPCVACNFEFLISVSPYLKLTTLGITLSGQAVKHRQAPPAFPLVPAFSFPYPCRHRSSPPEARVMAGSSSSNPPSPICSPVFPSDIRWPTAGVASSGQARPRFDTGTPGSSALQSVPAPAGCRHSIPPSLPRCRSPPVDGRPRDRYAAAAYLQAPSRGRRRG
jgi:hypothetical protein